VRKGRARSQRQAINSLKQAIGPCHPLFWGSHPQQGAQRQAQIKASRSNLVPLGEIFFSLERSAAHSAFIKDVLEAAFQVHAALAQKRFARLALYGTSGAIKDFSQRGGQSFFATPGTVGVPDHPCELSQPSFTSSRSGAIRGRVRFSGETFPVQIPRHEPALPSHVRFVEVARRPNVFALVQPLGPSYPTRPTFDMSGRRRLAGGCPLDGRVRCPVTVHVSGVPVS
jgi:hypothetical protein